MAEAQGLDNQTGKEPVEKSLKPFSDADIIGELSRRLHANSQLDITVLGKFDTVTAEIKEKLKPEEPKTDLKPATESGGAEVQAPSESEGKGWAKIIREKGAGFLFGKFKNSWGYYDENGSFHGIEPWEQNDKATILGFTSAGWFGKHGFPITGESIETYSRVAFYNGTAATPPKDTSSNFLVIGDAGANRKERDGFQGWKAFKYLSWYDLLQVENRAGHNVINLPFRFTLPPEESSQFVEAVNKNPDLIEDVFQNVYPGLVGEKGIKRLTVGKLALTDDIFTKEIEDREANEYYKKNHPEKKTPTIYKTILVSSKTRVLNFSKPVGEIAPKTP